MKSRNRVNSYAARITKMIADIEDRHHGPKHPSETIVFHNEDGNPARANIKQALGYLKDGDGDGNSQPHKGVKASANSDVMYSFTSAQDGDPLQDDVRLCLGDDLKKAQDHSQRQALLCDIVPTALDVKYTIKLVDGKLIRADTILRGYTLNFHNHPFNIDLMPIELDSFDVIIGMDWLTKYHTMIICDEKLVRIPFSNKTLTIRGNRSDDRHDSKLNIISCTKAKKYTKRMPGPSVTHH
ncbi:reverse transcriptase domain-containing protein [Tanacetum coccineum]